MLSGRTPRTDIGSHPISTASITSTLNQEIQPLTNAQSDKIRSVRYNGNEVVGDDGEVVAVDREVHDGFRTRVDHSQEMSLFGLEGELGETCEWRAVMRFRVERQQATVVVHLAVD